MTEQYEKLKRVIRNYWFRYRYRNAVIGWDIGNKDESVMVVGRKKKGKIIIDRFIKL